MYKKLIVGLGNPEEKYKWTRHNIGRMVLDYIKDLNKLTVINDKENRYHYFIYNDSIYLYCNMGMNDSGIPVKLIKEEFDIKNENILIILDDINFKCGTIRLKHSGSDGRHKGLRSILENLNSEEIARLKIGIDKPTSKDIILIDYVLGQFSILQLQQILCSFPNIISLIEWWEWGKCREYLKMIKD